MRKVCLFFIIMMAMQNSYGGVNLYKGNYGSMNECAKFASIALKDVVVHNVTVEESNIFTASLYKVWYRKAHQYYDDNEYDARICKNGTDGVVILSIFDESY